MTFIVKDNKGGADFAPVSSGMHHAVCYSIVDIGTQPQRGQFPSKRTVMFTWELPNETVDVERDGKKQTLPRVISNRYTLSLNSKGKLRPMLESWRGRPFSDEELEGFDLSRVLGANCFLNIGHKQADGKTYANVLTVNPLPKGMAQIKPVNPTVLFFMDEFEPTNPIVFPDSMPDWQQKVVMQSEEFQTHGKPVEAIEGPQTAFPVADDVNPDLESVPF